MQVDQLLSKHSGASLTPVLLSSPHSPARPVATAVQVGLFAAHV